MRIFITDDTRKPNWQEIIARLSTNDHVIIRDYSHPARATLALNIKNVCRAHGVSCAIAGDWRLAWKLDVGLHYNHHMLAGRALPLRPSKRHSVAVHSFSELKRARDRGLRLALISPVFATYSHPGARTLGRRGYHHLARQAQAWGMEAAALGGMNRQSAKLLFGMAQKTASIAAIEGIEGLSSLYFS